MEKSGIVIVLFLIVFLVLLCGNKKSAGRRRRERNPERKCEERDEKHHNLYEPMAGGYEDYMLNSGLEPSIVESHKRFTDEIQHRTSGASVETVFSHDVEPGNTWVGLRRPRYDIPVDVHAREVPSIPNEQMPVNRKYDRAGLF